MLELLAPEHRVTLLTPAPSLDTGVKGAVSLDAGVKGAVRAGQPPPPLPAGTVVETYGAAGRGGEMSRTARGLGRTAVRGLPLQTGLFFSADLRRRLRLLAPRADLAVLQLVRLAAHRDDLGNTPVLVDLIDDLALNFSRRAALDSWWLRPALALEARLLARAQRRLARSAAGVLLVCERDRREVTAGLPAAIAERVRIAGLAVAASGDPPRQAAGVAAAFDGPPRLVFTGNLGYFVNADAIAWWLREVWPVLAARRPDLQLVVAGDRPLPGLRRTLAAAGVAGAVTVVESPPDLAGILAGAAAALAPMRCGSGVPVKILEAWSQGVPVVASPWAAAGTTGVPGQDLLVAASPLQWVEAVDRLLRDPAEWRRLAANGRRRLEADYSRRQVKQQLLAAVDAAVARRPSVIPPDR
ncbi:MAG TPA: glycosyltransferase [Thermoanaerobaculia bacterium]|nr:glycosyltransferase [Thermoanaerobaculia bacterium]